ncbi:MAG TPA: hypothetical protein VHC42_01105 [Rhizomicrobium sp.]|jgi:hypothetical protein|nr:hypothetical protein [Rhizomicrobium sp.]
MDYGLEVVAGLVALAAVLGSAARGYYIPSYAVAALAAVAALYFTQQDEPKAEILCSWGLSAIAIIVGIVGLRIKRARGD